MAEKEAIPKFTKIGGTEYNIAGVLAIKKEDFLAMHKHIKNVGEAYDKIQAEYGAKSPSKKPQE